MQVTETLSEGLKREYRVVVPADRIEAEVSGKLDELQRTVQIKGFRPGKVPLALLRKRFESSVMGEVLQSTIDQTAQQALMDQGVRPALQPAIEIEKYEIGSDLEYKVAVEALPDIEPPDMKTLSLTRLKAEIADKEVDESVERLAQQQRSFAEVATPRAAAKGDVVRIDFVGRVDGEPFEGGAATDYQIELGSGTFIPGFEDQVIGAKPGEKVEVKVSFPEDYPGKNVAGKDAVFDVDVKAVLEAEAVTIDDEFAQKMGLGDLAALKAAVREQMEREYARASRMKLKRELLDKLAESETFEVPPGMVEREFESIWHQVGHDMEHAGKTWADLDQTEDEAKDEYRRIAERRVRLGLLLAEVGRRNEITVPQEALNRAVMEQARRYPGQEQQVFDYFRNDPEAMNTLQAPLYEDKVVDFMVEMANVSDKMVSAEELMRDPDSENEADAAAADGGKKAGKGASKAKSKPKTKAKAKSRAKPGADDAGSAD